MPSADVSAASADVVEPARVRGETVRASRSRNNQTPRPVKAASGVRSALGAAAGGGGRQPKSDDDLSSPDFGRQFRPNWSYA